MFDGVAVKTVMDCHEIGISLARVIEKPSVTFPVVVETDWLCDVAWQDNLTSDKEAAQLNSSPKMRRSWPWMVSFGHFVTRALPDHRERLALDAGTWVRETD